MYPTHGLEKQEVFIIKDDKSDKKENNAAGDENDPHPHPAASMETEQWQALKAVCSSLKMKPSKADQAAKADERNTAKVANAQAKAQAKAKSEAKVKSGMQPPKQQNTSPDDTVIEKTVAYTKQMGRWRAMTLTAAADKLWGRVVAVLNATREPIIHLTSFLKKNIDLQVEHGHLAQLIHGKATEIETEFLKLMSNLTINQLKCFYFCFLFQSVLLFVGGLNPKLCSKQT